MSSSARELSYSEALFQRAPVTVRDQRLFVVKLVVTAALLTAGCMLALTDHWLPAVAGILVLGFTYTHAVELQHQCLHHTAFRRPRPHRLVGIPLGLPMLVSYSHYRVRHLQHHKYLGTPQDSEFFGFDTRQPLTFGALARGLFDFPRVVFVLRDSARSFRGTWTYDLGQIAERRRREIMAEYRLMGLVLLALGALSVAGAGEYVVRLWLLPLLIAVPLHFLVELPEHILCDTDTTDVLRNTRSIRGSRLSTWYTNGNNLHIEHHAAMTVPMNRLRERHHNTERCAVYVERSYADFFRLVFREARSNSSGTAEKERGAAEQE